MTQHEQISAGTSKGYAEEEDREGKDIAIWASYQSEFTDTLA